ncbi:MAG TPA: MFS transporter [Acidimicrobiales bacterium]|nr:MFS transporter [Acidimicrobiales bacterium]
MARDPGGGLKRHLRMDLSPLRESRDLRILFAGGGISFAGSMLTYVALPYQAYQLSHSSLVVGLLSLAELIPLLATAFIGGALADAVDRRRMLRLTEVGQCLATAVLVLNSALGRPQLWVLFAVSVVTAGVDGLQRPSLDAIVPQIVRPEQLAATSAIMSVRSQLGMIAAPALTGVIIAAGGLTLTYSLDVASFVISLGFLWRLGTMPPPAGDSDLSLAAIRAGLSYAWARKDLLGTYLVDMNAMFFGMPNALFPQIASHMGGASALGVLYASPAVGSFLVTLTSGWTAKVRRHGRMIAVAATVWGAGIVLLGFASALWVAALGLVAAGAGDMVSGLGRMTMWNQSIPDGLRGRLAGIEMLSYSSGPTLGNVEAGLVETFAGLRTSIVAGGVFSIVGTGLLSLALPAFWRYDAREGAKLRHATG